MRMKIEFVIVEHIAAPHQFVYDILTTYQTYQKWKSGLTSIRVLSGYPDIVSEDSIWREERKIRGAFSSDVYETTGALPGLQLHLKINGWKGTSRRGEYLFHFHLIKMDSQTALILKHETLMKGIHGLFAYLMLPLRKARALNDLRRLKEFAEHHFTHHQSLTK